MTLTPLRACDDVTRYGGKASSLARCLTAGLPVPDGYALAVDDVAAIARGERSAHGLGDGRYAVRSSAVDEDGARASYAGQHTTLLGVAAADVDQAVCEVHASAASPAARAYRERMGRAGEPRMAVVIQPMVRARVAGVLFGRDPVTGDEVIAIEASWGVGEAVVQGLVTPDAFRVAWDGQVLSRVPGEKDIALLCDEHGSVAQAEIDAERVDALCLDDDMLRRLWQLAQAARDAFPGAHDIEWAFDEEGRLALLQLRGITT